MGRFLLPADVTAQELQALIHETWRGMKLKQGEMGKRGKKMDRFSRVKWKSRVKLWKLIPFSTLKVNSTKQLETHSVVYGSLSNYLVKRRWSGF